MSSHTAPIFRSLPGRVDRGLVQGLAAMLVTVLIWACFALSTRATSAAVLGFGDVAMIRALVPTLVFLPFLPARLGMIRQAGVLRCGVIATGAGIPFFMLAVGGGAVTSAAHVAALIAGMAPVFVALLHWGLTRRLPSRRGGWALLVITGGAALLIASQAVTEGKAPDAGGVLMLLCASLFWSAFTTAVRGSGLDPLGSALVIAVPSSALIGLLLLSGAVSSQWGTYGIREAAPFVLIQGVGVGVVATLTYAFAIARLGPDRCATIGAAAPALAALLAVPLLNEPLQLMAGLAILAIATGVILFNRP